MIKRIFLSLVVLAATGIITDAQTNLIGDWDGKGDVNNSTSFPNNYGWAVTVGSFNYANSTSGVRWFDAKTNSNPVHFLKGSAYSGRLLMVRWDGAGSTSLNSVYSYPVSLEANKKYQFTWIYEWWNNASVPILSVGIGTDKTGTNLLVSKEFPCSSTKNQLLEGEMSFFSSSAGTYYLSIKANNLAVLCGIGELAITEVPAVLECSPASVTLNYYLSEKTISIFPNGSPHPITLSASEGIGLSTQTLPFSGGQVRVFSPDSSNVTGSLTINQATDIITIPVTCSFPKNFLKPVKPDTLNPDGAWCWFNDPRAVYHKGIREQTYFSWVNRSGDILIASYNHTNGEYKETVLFPKLEVDDHDNPAIFIRNDGHLIVFFSKHTTAPGHRFISKNPEDISSWGEDYQYGENVTYPYPFQVGNQIYVLYRGLNWHPTLIVSNDNGLTFGAPQQIIAGGGARPYTRFCQDKTGAIHFAFTTGHPRDVANNKIYYACLRDGKFYKADGTFIKEFTGTSSALTIDKNEAETVYDASKGKGWIWDITVDEGNQPVMVFASFPSDTDHRYHYARWTGTQWFSKEITNGGKWFPQTIAGGTESEPNYSGGIIMDYNDPSIVYLSKQVKNSFEIFRFTTPDKGTTWDSTAITWNTPSNLVNVRPIVPRNHKKGYFDLLWMRGSYIHYTNYNTAIVYYADSSANRIDSIAFDTKQIMIKKGGSKKINVQFYPFLTRDKSLIWNSSDESIAQVTNGTITAISPGSAFITATAVNGTKATCEIRVEEPNYINKALFDFGTSTSPVAAGAIQVSETTLFTDSYGWLSTLLSRDRGAAASDELRDFNMSSQRAVFKVLVRPGTYRIVIQQGDLQYPHDNMKVEVNDSLVLPSVSTSTGNFMKNEFIARAYKGMLEFAFSDAGGTDVNWVVNSIEISEIIIDSSHELKEEPGFSAFSLMNIYEISGRKIFSQKIEGKDYRRVINSLMLSRGVYLVTLANKNRIETIKHIID